jgi:hypothetical protein
MKLDDSNAKGKKKKGGNYAVERKPIGKGPTTCNAILPHIVAFFCFFWGYFFFIVELCRYIGREVHIKTYQNL